MFRLSMLLAVVIAASAQNQTQRTPREERVKLSDMGLRILQKASDAQSAIQKKDKDLAAQRVREALFNVSGIEAEEPRAKPPLRVTLYTEQIQFTVGQKVAPGQSVGSANRSAAPKPGEEVRDAEGQATRIWMDVTAAKRELQTAQAALNRGDWNAASSALDAVSKQDVYAQSVVADLPLLKARRNLGIAADDVRKQQYDSVAVPLQAASSALSEYVNGKGPHAQDAAAMRSQIDAFAKNVGQHHADAVSQIDKWWNQVNDWFTPLEPPPAK